MTADSRTLVAVACTGLLLSAGCAPSLDGVAATPPAPEAPWTPPPGFRSRIKEPTPTVIPADLLQRADSLGLADIVDVALRSSSLTRESWAAARSAAAAWGSQRGAYLPSIDLGANATTQKALTSGGNAAFTRRSYGPSGSVDWLLFNFGGRRAAVEETRQALIAADWTHNATIQNVILEVEQAYYDYEASKALLAAQTVAVRESQSNYDAADARRQAGLATIADVLQAQTALSQAQLSYQTLSGQIATTRGALATAMGLPANVPYDVAPLPEEPPTEKVSEDVDHYLEEARASRPDLAAARADAERALAHIKTVRAEGLPSISAVGNAARIYENNPHRYSDTYLAAIQLEWPFFTGFSHHYDVAQAKADAEAALARLQTTDQQAVLQVWTSYYGLKTAEQRYRTSQDLLASATQSQQVAAGRYQEGVGTILDLLTAETALQEARAQQVQARADWYISLAQLAHDTGVLTPSAAGVPANGAPKGGRP
jgi:outer membrane protein